LQGTLYKDKNCPCCEGHARYLERNGIHVDIKPAISLPGMPTGVPGMGGPYEGPYKVYAIKKDGSASVFAEQTNAN
jgi:hypothetical protein